MEVTGQQRGSMPEYVFYMEASNNAENNIIQLDYVSKKAEDMPYHEITGNICDTDR